MHKNNFIFNFFLFSRTVLCIISSVFLFLHTFSQNDENRKKAKELKSEAIKLSDNGDPDKAIDLLESAKKLDPADYSYQYEIGYAYYVKKDFQNAIKSFEEVIKYPDVTDQCYQMLGNSYDLNKERDKAKDAYNRGLKIFPYSGRLYLESGVLEGLDKNYDSAILLWEKGIQVEPTYPSTYYRLAKLFASSKDRIWALLYGELFINIERNSKRTAEISKLLFDVYSQSISFPSDTSINVDLTTDVIKFDGKKDFKIPFRIVCGTELVAAMSVPLITKKRIIDIDFLNKTRTSFIYLWFEKQEQYKDYPNILFDFEKTLKDKGFLEAYNYWLLMKGNEPEFQDWYKNNKDNFDAFIKWFTDNPLQVNSTHFFVRTQYD
jgi:tetratricopeptide (TPR) repeat protein